MAEAGFELVPPDDFNFEVLLVDTDHPDAPPIPHKHQFILEALRRGVQVGLYPHGGLPILDYDWGRPALPLAFELVHGEGHKEIYERIGLKRRVEAVGWSYTDVLPKSDTPIKHVVFAPIHPWADGKSILPFHQRANEIAYEEFLNYPYGKKTVRMYGEDAPNGVTERVDGVEYTQSDLKLGVDLIDSSDAVISYGTFACTALARGKRVAMIFPYPPHMSDDGKKNAEHFGDYADYCRYPDLVGDGSLFQTDTSEWERLFIGGPLDVDKVGEILNGYRWNRKQRRKRARA